MKKLFIQNLLTCSTIAVIGFTTLSNAAACPPDTATNINTASIILASQNLNTTKAIDALVKYNQRVILKADKDGKLIEVRVKPTDIKGKDLVISADSIRIDDARGITTGNLALTAQGSVVMLEAKVNRKPTMHIGIVTEAVSEALAGHLKVIPDASLLITEVLKGAPAIKAGIRKHDVITHIQGTKGVNLLKLKELIQSSKSGQTIKLSIVREGEPKEVIVIVEEAKPAGILRRLYEARVDRLTELNLLVEPSQLRSKGLEIVSTRPVPLLSKIYRSQPQRQKWVTIDPKISNQILQITPQYDTALRSYSKLLLALETDSDSVEAQLQAAIEDIEEQLEKIKILASKLATSRQKE